MMGRNSVVGITSLVALALCAITVSSAFAAPGRGFTCAPGGTQFSDAHCLTAGTGFGHTSIANGAPTQIAGTNAKTAGGTTAAAIAKLKGKVAGLVTEVQCTGVGESGEITNSATSLSGSGTIEYSGCVVTAPAGRNCVVTGGTITWKPLAFTTAGLTNNNELKFSPAIGTELATTQISGCLNNIPPAGSYPLSGTFIATMTGATATTTHAGITTQGTVSFAGTAVGLDLALTMSMVGGNPFVLT